MSRIKKIARKILFLETIEDYSMEKRRILWPEVKSLEEKHIRNCKLKINREELLKHVPKNAVCAEIGIAECVFSETILKITEPEKLHLYDIEPACIQIGNDKFSKEVTQQKVCLHLGDSSTLIKTLPDSYFDWVYIDGEHTYEACKKDLETVHPKMKQQGLILLNDYTYFAPSDFKKYGVIEAVNEFCLKYDHELLFVALQGRGYYDVMLRKIP